MAVTLEQAVAAQTPVSGGLRPAPPMLRCPRCQSLNNASQRFCSTCGFAFGSPQGNNYQQVAQSGSGYVTCPTCRAPNRAIDRFCTQCGQPLQR